MIQQPCAKAIELTHAFDCNVRYQRSFNKNPPVNKNPPLDKEVFENFEKRLITPPPQIRGWTKSLRDKFFTLHDDVSDKFRLYLQTKLQNYMYIIHQHILLLFHAYFIQISSYPPLHMNIPYMFFIISIWKCYVVSECIMNTLRKH